MKSPRRFKATRREALAGWTEAIAQDQNNVEAYNNRGMFYFREENYAAAIQDLSRVSVQRKERETMIYHTHNLTGCLVALQSKASMRRFLRDRQRSVESKMRKVIKAGLRAGCPVADALIVEMCLILALQDELEGYTHGT